MGVSWEFHLVSPLGMFLEELFVCEELLRDALDHVQPIATGSGSGSGSRVTRLIINLRPVHPEHETETPNPKP